MDWFERVTGFPESDYAATQARLVVRDGRLCPDSAPYAYRVGTLELVSLAELRQRAQTASLPGTLSQDIVYGDARRLHADPRFAGALFQVASQFNLLEMIGPGVTPEQGVAVYAHDRTQGPACAVAAGAGTIYRNYLVPVGSAHGQTADRQLNALADLERALSSQLGIAPSALWSMSNGYVLPEAAQLARIERHLATLGEAERDALRSQIRIGLHWDVEVTETDAAPNTLVSQAYCSAMPVRYSGIPAAQWSGLAQLILEAAYEATLLAGLLNATRGTSPIIMLTRLGGGAFGNVDAWIDHAIDRSLGLLADTALRVLEVSYRA